MKSSPFFLYYWSVNVSMPNKYHHQIITRQALKSAGITDAPLLIEEYCSFPDNFHRDYDNIAPYMFIMDKMEFHYPPHTPVDQFYRYWDHVPHQKTIMLDREENYNSTFAEAGFRFYFEHCIEALRNGKREDAWKFLGCLLHFLEDSAFGIHALEGPDGTDIYVLDRMSGKQFAKYICSIPLDDALTELEVVPQILASDIDEAVARLYFRYVEATAISRQAAFDIALEYIIGKSNHALLENQRTMFLSAVQLAADTAATVLAIAGNRAPEVPKRNLSGFAPFYYPIGGGGGFQLSRYELKGDDFTFGVNLEARLLFKIPSVYKRFTGRIITSEVENTSLEIINNGNVCQTFKLNGNMDIALDIHSPGGVFGLRCTAPAGKGRITLANGVFER